MTIATRIMTEHFTTIMKKNKPIRNLDTLEKEMYRLELQAKNIEEKLDHNLDHLQENYLSMTMNSFFCKKENKKETGGHFWSSFFNHDGVNAAMNKMAGDIATKAAEGIDSLLDKLFHKKKD